MAKSKPYRAKPERLTKAQQRANYDALMESFNKPIEPPLRLSELHKELNSVCAEWEKLNLTPLSSALELFDNPKRALFLVQKFLELDKRTDILFDKATHEFIEFRVRGVGLFNDLGEAGVGYLQLDREAEDWARSQLSERVVKPDGSIAKFKGKIRKNIHAVPGDEELSGGNA